uniref:Uncharacterized protein n=1 Tax=Arundo donax TaxID=35708 RepID=A0A0A9BCR1_ARUDO
MLASFIVSLPFVKAACFFVVGNLCLFRCLHIFVSLGLFCPGPFFM